MSEEKNSMAISDEELDGVAGGMCIKKDFTGEELSYKRAKGENPVAGSTGYKRAKGTSAIATDLGMKNSSTGGDQIKIAKC